MHVYLISMQACLSTFPWIKIFNKEFLIVNLAPNWQSSIRSKGALTIY